MSTLQIHTRELRFEAPANALAADAPIPCTIATSTPVNRWGVLEVLDCSPTGVDLARAPLPLIIAHDSTKLSVGLVEGLSAAGERVTGLVRFGTSAEAQQIRADVLAGIHRSLSVGYALLGEGEPVAGGLMYRWQPHEVSIVPVPADPAAGFYRSHSQGNISMNTPTLMTSDEINALCLRHHVPTLAQGLVAKKATLPVANQAIIEELAARDLASGGHLNVAEQNQQSLSGERELIVNTLVARMGGKVAGAVIGATDCTGLAVRSLQMAGRSVNRSDSRDVILQRAMTTSDFPVLLGNAAGKILLDAFDETPASLKLIARLNNLPNFKNRTVIRLPGGAPSLEKVNEHGEFKHGAMNEEDNAWRLATYGRIVSLTRQALVNDDLSAFSNLLMLFGQAAARREADELAAMLTGSPTVDGAALFSADRLSLLTGAGSALAIAGLEAAVKNLRLQKEVGGGFIIQEPQYLVVPAALETKALQLMATIAPNAAASVQPYKLTIVVEPRLDAASATAWYLAAGNQRALEYGYLDGATGPQTFQREGFDIDGLDVKCRLDFGAGWVAPIGWVKSAGA